MVHIRNKYFYLFSIFLLLDVWMAFAQSAISEKDFRTNTHPRIFVTMDDKQAIQAKIELVNWARDIYEVLKADVDPIIAMHQDNPGYVVSRMQMHWEPGKRYTHFYTEELRQKFLQLAKTDGSESNPIILIQKLKK